MRALVDLAKSKGIDHINEMLQNIGDNEILLALILTTAKQEATR